MRVANQDPIDLRGVERIKAENDAKRRLEALSEEEDFKWLMSSRRGRRIVFRLLELAGVYRISFSQNSMQMAFNEGNRNYGNRVLTILRSICVEQLPAMEKENARTDDGNADHSN